MSTHFYSSLVAFDKFDDVTNPMRCLAAPMDWLVVVTDIEGSTTAIEEGRYKHVNLTGAATIIASLNAADGIDIPYVFGGDGATLLIPPRLLQPLSDALSGLQEKVQEMFALKLRVGIVPVKYLYERHASVRVGKYQVSPHITQATFHGDGLQLAENWVKSRHPLVIEVQPRAAEADLNGLECRWDPVQSRNGVILSLLVRVTPKHMPQMQRIYSEVLSEINTIYSNAQHSFPVSPERMSISLSPSRLRAEAQLRGGKSVVAQACYIVSMIMENLMGRVSRWLSCSLLGFHFRRYVAEVVANTDARKFDEMLRMVIDSTLAQQERLESLLQKRHERGEIIYGVHGSPQALMTCLVFSRQGNHVHFIDGDNGGYALAARMMKQQAAALSAG